MSLKEFIIPTVIDETARGVERSYDIFSRILQDRLIFLIGEIDERSTGILIAQLLYLDNINHDPIILYIHSGGGEVYSAFGILNIISKVKSPVYTYCTGIAASAAALVLSSGAKGHRSCFQYGRIMIHQPHGGAHGQATDIAIQSKEINEIKRMINQLLADNCNISIEKCNQLMERDTYLNANEDKELGLIDIIL